MTDYLTNLLDKALGRASVIQPPRASFFAPSPDTVSVMDVGSLPSTMNVQTDAVKKISEVESLRSGDPRAPWPSRGNSSQGQVDAAPSYESPTAEPRNGLPDKPLDTRRHETAPNAAPTAHSHTEQARVNTNAEAKLAPREGSLKPNPLDTIRVPEPARVDEEMLLAKFRALIPRSLPVTPEDGRVEKTILRDAAVDARSTRPVANDVEDSDDAPQPRTACDRPKDATPLAFQLSPAVQPQVRPLPQLSPRPAAPILLAPTTSPAPAPPTIQVTIGRIEVRASSAAPQPQRKTTGGPRLTLEAYLQERNGGAR